MHAALLNVLHDPAYHHVLTVGDGIDGDFTDRLATRYMDDYFWKYADKNQPDKAVATLAEKLVAWYEDHYGVRLDSAAGNSGAAYVSEPYSDSYAEPYSYYEPAPARPGGGLFTLLAVVLIVWLLYKAKVFSSAKLWPPVSGAQKPAREDGI